VAVNPGDGTLYAVVQDARLSGFGYDTIALTQSTDGGQGWSPLVRINPGSDAGAGRRPPGVPEHAGRRIPPG
jgi:hypothetical protein